MTNFYPPKIFSLFTSLLFLSFAERKREGGKEVKKERRNKVKTFAFYLSEETKAAPLAGSWLARRVAGPGPARLPG